MSEKFDVLCPLCDDELRLGENKLFLAYQCDNCGLDWTLAELLAAEERAKHHHAALDVLEAGTDDAHEVHIN